MKTSFLIAVVFLATNAFAQSEEPSKELPRGSYVVHESAVNRENKQWEVHLIGTGLGPSLTGTTGVVAAYHLSTDQEVLIELTSGSLEADSSFSSSVSTDKTGSSYDIKSKSLGVHYKQFTGNSFYFRTGADFRTIDYNYQYRSVSFPADNADIEFTGTSFAANFQIGNQWQWDNFTLGCDWVGISVPITHSISDERFVSTGLFEDYDRKRMADDKKFLVEGSNLNLLRFYLGASF